MRAVYLLPVAGQPRFWKRIHALAAEGVEPVVLAFERSYIQPRPEDAERVEVIASMSHGRYGRRLFSLARAFLPLYRRCRDADALYCFGTDLAALGVAIRLVRPRLRLVVEVGDIRPVMAREGLKGRLLRWLERRVLRRVSFIVVTSPAYRDRYFVERQGVAPERVLVVENKVDERVCTLAEPARQGARAQADAIRADIDSASDVRGPGARGGPLTIGYFGLIRCRRSWNLLQRVVAAMPERFRVEVWGRIILEGPQADPDGLPPGMVYHGEYLHPDDLPRMFPRFDLAWVANGYGSTNVRWARANRFYDSCCFATPLVGQTGTQDGAEIERLGIGVCLDVWDPESAADRIASITPLQVAAWTHRILELDPDVYRYASEHATLAGLMERNGMP